MAQPEPSVFDDLDADSEAAADAEGLADIEAGRMVSWEAVKRWLLSWGTSEVLPIPRIGDSAAGAMTPISYRQRLTMNAGWQPLSLPPASVILEPV